MAYNEETAKRLRDNLQPFEKDIVEKRMFGGLTFLYKGKMSVGVIKDDLCVRVVESKIEKVMRNPNVRPMDFTGKPLKGFIYVDQKGFETELELFEWIQLGIEHAEMASKKK